MKNNNLKAVLPRDHSFFLAVPALLWQVLFFYVPLAFIVVVSVLKQLDYSFFGNFTFDHYATLLKPVYYQIIGRSFSLAFFNSLFCFLLAYPIAYFLAFRARHLRNLLLFLLVLPFLASFLVQVYAWFAVFERGGFLNSVLLGIGVISEPLHILNTPLAIYIVMLFCYLPFMVLPIYSSLEKIGNSFFEVSADLGASRWQTIWRIIMPLSSPGVRIGFLLVFIPSFGEFVVPALLGGSRQMFVGSLISYLFLETRSTFVGAAFTCLSGAVLIVGVLFLLWLLRKVFGRDRV